MTYDLKFFEDKITKLEEEYQEMVKKSTSLSVLRFVVFFLFILPSLISLFITEYKLIAGIILFLSLASFIYSCVIHTATNKRITLLKNLIDINREYIARVNVDFSGLFYSGSDFFDSEHPYCLDLDIVGDRSIFMLYNISESVFGRKRFAEKLLSADKSVPTKKQIDLEREKVSFLEGKIDFLQEYQAYERAGGLDKEPGALLELASEKKSLSKIKKLFYKVDPFLWLVPLIPLCLGFGAAAKTAALILVFINLVIMFIVPTAYDSFFKKGRIIERQASALAVLFRLTEKEGLTKGYVKNLKVLSDACFLMGLRSQPIFALILNILMPFDFWCADRLSNWAITYGDDLKQGIDELSELESQMSASVVGIVSRGASVPEIITFEDRAALSGTNMRHPLLNPDRAVGNSVTLEGQRSLITGSNMSGKTTLIRTCGVLAVLSYLGASVPADSFKLTPMRIAASMRIMDSLEENMSTFRAELIKIGRIISASKESGPLMFLIDEIFRGTNSTDRTEGALTVLKQLSLPRIIGFMTTHDYALCDRTETEMKNILYYHFSESYNDTGITFDYKLSSGISHASNAKYLMKLVGIE